MTATLQTRARPGSDSPQPAVPDEAAIAAIEAHRSFDAAYDRAARGILALFEGNRVLATVMSDRVRVLLAVAVLCLDADADEEGRRLTPARMIEAARDFGLGSPGRVKAMLAILRWGGYLAPTAGVSDRRERPLVPTEKLWNVVLARWRVLFEALMIVDPIGATALAATGDQRFRQAFARNLARIFARGFRPLARSPRLKSCTDRDAGFMILSRETRGETDVDWGRLAGLLAAARDAMIARGGAKLGDKTVLDALDAVARACEGLSDPAAIGGAAREAVRQALDAYREKPCRIGRARMFAERSVGKDDPGMLAFTRLAEALVPGAGR